MAASSKENVVLDTQSTNTGSKYTPTARNYHRYVQYSKGVLQSLRIEGSNLSEFSKFWGAPISTNFKMKEAPIFPNFELE